MDVILFDFYENCNYLDVHITFCAFFDGTESFLPKGTGCRIESCIDGACGRNASL